MFSRIEKATSTPGRRLLKRDFRQPKVMMDVLMDDIAVETSGTPDNTTGQTIEAESENGDDGDLLKSDVQRYVKYHNKFSHLGLVFYAIFTW
ncbi:hypothetical protein E4U50_006927 [Claviceps purpurea]|nr:hypothetical protein E4U50_006927 [Claviceps purpurea]